VRAARGALLALVASGLLPGLAADAQTRRGPDIVNAFRTCARADLIGAWQVLRMGVAPTYPVDKTDPAFSTHQRYVFDANANLYHLTSTRAITPDEQRALLAATPPVTWAVDAEGRLLTQRPGQPRLDTSTCQVVLVETRDPRSDIPPAPGDVVLTLLSDGQPVVRRLLRRVEKLP
jgi:hypothetical protein